MSTADRREDVIELDEIPAKTVRAVAGWLRHLARPANPLLTPGPELIALVEAAADLVELVHGLGGPNLEPTLVAAEAWDRLGDLIGDYPVVVALGAGAAPLALLPVVDIDVWTSADGAGPMVRLITGIPA